MQNISAVLADMGRQRVDGLLPAANVGAGVKARLEKMIQAAEKEEAPQQSYKVKLPAIRDWLIGVARNQGVATYGDLKLTFGTDFFSLNIFS